jgi:hypothetical protein
MPQRVIPHARTIGINIGTAFAGGPANFRTITGSWKQQSKEADAMRCIKLHRAIILAGAIGLGTGCATVDAFARGGAGGAGGGHAGHAGPSGGGASGHAGPASGHAGIASGHVGLASGHVGLAGSHAGSLSPVTTVGSASRMHTGPGTVSVRFGNTTVTE